MQQLSFTLTSIYATEMCASVKVKTPVRRISVPHLSGFRYTLTVLRSAISVIAEYAGITLTLHGIYGLISLVISRSFHLYKVMDRYRDRVPVRTIGSGTRYDGKVWYESLGRIRSINGTTGV
jgi:hypothetical protein